MENIRRTDLDAETAPGTIGKRLGGGLEEDVVDHLAVSQGKGVELNGQGEDDMEVLDGEELFPPCLDPLLFPLKMSLPGIYRFHGLPLSVSVPCGSAGLGI